MLTKKRYIENLFRLIRNFIITKILFPVFVRKKKTSKKYYATICAIFKNEAKYFKEWLEYYQEIGIDHFYLYNNNSDDNYQKVLAPYIKEGLVTLVEWPEKPGQMSSYLNCIETFSDEADWIGFIDLDEFICPVKYYKVSQWLQKFERYPTAYIFWKFFGSKGTFNESEYNLVSEHFILASPIEYGCKLFFNTRWAKKVKSFHIPHVMRIKSWGVVIPQHSRLFFRLRKTLPENKIDIQINHYYCKSYEYQIKKKIVCGLVLRANQNYDISGFFDIDTIATTPDYKIYKYVSKLKERLNQTK